MRRKRLYQATPELIDFANAIRECLGLEPFPNSETGWKPEQERFYRVWPDASPGYDVNHMRIPGEAGDKL